MRLLSYSSDRGVRAGALVEDRIIDLWDALGSPHGLGDRPPEGPGIGPTGLRAALTAFPTPNLCRAIDDAADAPTVDPTTVRLEAPITDPEKIICIGLNYRAHAEEAGIEPPPVPTFFAKFANALAADGDPVTLPAASEKVDYEAEVAVVIGRTAHEIDAAQALDHVAGYTLLNDLSARDLQFQTPQWIPGKVFDGSAPCGPFLVTADEIEDPGAIGIALDRNGERMQDATTGDLIFGIPEIVSHLSRLMTLRPGDLISTGTPAGVGSTRKPRVWLEPGDDLVVSSPQLGELRTTIRR